MSEHFNFPIHSQEKISSCFSEKGITDFSEAAAFIRSLPYRRNSSKTNPEIIFAENCGTCSTKHAVLALLASENKIPGVKLMLGIYRMNGNNTPATGNTLKKYKLDYIPEAHNYLRINGTVFDCTGISSTENSFENDLMEEIEIRAEQIGDFKIKYQQGFIQNWIKENQIIFSPEEIWKIREECINSITENFTRKKRNHESLSD